MLRNSTLERKGGDAQMRTSKAPSLAVDVDLRSEKGLLLMNAYDYFEVGSLGE